MLTKLKAKKSDRMKLIDITNSIDPYRTLWVVGTENKKSFSDAWNEHPQGEVAVEVITYNPNKIKELSEEFKKEGWEHRLVKKTGPDYRIRVFVRK